MKIAKNISASLVVCVAAGAFAAGALFVEPSDPSTSSPATASSGAAAAAPSGRYAAEGGPTSRNAGSSAATIEISGFNIAAVRVAPGARVTVFNRDDTQHTITARDRSFSTGKIDGGSSVSFVAPRAPGKYDVFCEIHPAMRSTLMVG